MNTNYDNDQPITSEIEDELNRISFSKQIAETLILDVNKPCFTVSLEGHWGYGKTSILNMVKANFESMETPPIVVEYNAWVNGKPESLIQDFLIQFTSQLGLADYSGDGQNIAKELLSYSKLFSVAKLIPGVEPWGSLIEKTLKGVGEVTESLSDLKELSVEDKKAEVEKQLRKINRPIVVIIDDIDRLTPKEAFQVLRLVKAVANFTRTSFILSFEPSYLESILAHNKIDNAHEYIDKIVQLRLPVPNITTRDIDNLINQQFEGISGNFSFDYYQDDNDRFSYLYRQYLQNIITTPRDVKRILNHFKFSYNLIKNQVCITDLFILSVIAVKAHKIYNNIKSNPTLYAESGESENFNYSYLNKEKSLEEFKRQRHQIYKELALSEDNLYEQLLSEIFPTAFNNQMTLYIAHNADASGRIDDINRLSTALQASTPKRAVSDQYVIDFIKEDNKHKMVEDTITSDSINRFLELFEILFEKEQPNINEQLKLIMIIIDSLSSHNMFDGYHNIYSGMFSNKSLYQNIAQLLNRVLRNSDDKESVINLILEEESFIPFSSYLLSRLKAQHNENSHEEPWFDTKEIDILIIDHAKNAERILVNNTLKSRSLEYHTISILWHYFENAALDIMKLIDHSNVLKVGWLLLGRMGSDSSNGNYLSVSLDKVESIINLKELRENATKLANNLDLSLEDKAILSSIIDGHPHYLNGGEKVSDW
ncbi:KAP family P-loop NTPase fold protein [Aliivibrio fischeri]|uniref:KAP family P-loop NTPase fold protein n=1 Tax=Aliivibrio fischeri TaxID=668 RepID=UPI003735FE21